MNTRHKEVDVKGIEFDKKLLSFAAFRKFEEAKKTVKTTSASRISPHSRKVNSDHVKVITLGTSSALPSKYRNGKLLFLLLRNRSDNYGFFNSSFRVPYPDPGSWEYTA